MAITPEKYQRVTILSKEVLDGMVFVRWKDGCEMFVTADFLTPETDAESELLGKELPSWQTA